MSTANFYRTIVLDGHPRNGDVGWLRLADAKKSGSSDLDYPRGTQLRRVPALPFNASVIVELGVRLARPIPIEDIPDVARTIEALGFASLFLTEWDETADVPDARWSPDALMALTAAATSTSRLEVGTAVCVPTTREPAELARQAYSVAALAGGRFTLGVAAIPTGGEPAPAPSEDDFVGFMTEVWAELSARSESVPPPRIGVRTDSLPQANRHLLAYGDVWMVHASRLQKLTARASDLPDSIFALDVDRENVAQHRWLTAAGVDMALFAVTAHHAVEVIADVETLARRM